jgi:TPR repeat protein
MYQNGLGVTQSYAQADTYYTSAIRHGDAASFNLRAILYFQGWGVSKNPQMALAFLQQGAALGDAWAQLHLGELYSGVSSSQQGRNALLTAPSDAVPVLNLGTKLQPDLGKAFSLLEASANGGNRIAACKAGAMLEQGTGVAKDYTKALAYYRRSAADGYGPAQQALGRMYERGLGTTADLVKAYVHYSISQLSGSGAFGSPDIERVRKQLTPAELARAEAIVQASPARTMVGGSRADEIEAF